MRGKEGGRERGGETETEDRYRQIYYEYRENMNIFECLWRSQREYWMLDALELELQEVEPLSVGSGRAGSTLNYCAISQPNCMCVYVYCVLFFEGVLIHRPRLVLNPEMYLLISFHALGLKVCADTLNHKSTTFYFY